MSNTNEPETNIPVSDSLSETDKLAPDDPAVQLYGSRKLNTKTLKLFALGGLGLLGVGLIISFGPTGQNGATSNPQDLATKTSVPDNLRVRENDFYRNVSASGPSEYIAQETPPNPRYNSYTPVRPDEARPQTDNVVYVPQVSQPAVNQQPARDPAYTSSLTFGGASSGFGSGGSSDSAGSTAGSYGGPRTPTEAQLQNQQSLKNDFLDSLNSSNEIYLDARYERSVAYTQELTAGTLIPIVLITGVNSDLPGMIVAQVIQDVWDTYTGQNILIPAGTRVIGTYDSSIAFGQDRVLVAWTQLLRPDGVTISLRGMQGVDQQGYSGFQDQVDYHFANILSTMLMSSGFELGANAIVSALSSVDVFAKLADLQTSNATTMSPEDQFISTYAQRALNQQPTIKIREGFRGFIIVNKNIILPPFTAW